MTLNQGDVKSATKGSNEVFSPELPHKILSPNEFSTGFSTGGVDNF